MAHLCSYSNFRSEIFMFAQILFWVISSNGFNSTANFPRLLKIMNSFKYIKLLEEERLIRVFLGLISMALCYVLLKFIQTTLRWNYFTKKTKFVFQQNDGYMIIIGRHEEHQLYSLCLPLNTLICMRIHEHNARIFETSIQCQHLIMANA